MTKAKNAYAVCMYAAGDEPVHLRKMEKAFEALKQIERLSACNSAFAFIQPFTAMDTSELNQTRLAIDLIARRAKRAEIVRITGV